jgi:polyhydroxyalkanoate synthesis regulator phasin
MSVHKKRSVMDLAHWEMVEKQLDAMIQRRARKGEMDPDEGEALWQASVRAYEEKRRQMARLEWHVFHCGQAERHRATLQALIEHHEMQAAKLCEGEGVGYELH